MLWILTYFGSWLDHIVPASFRAVVAAQAWWLQAIEVVVLSDFCIYWAHRLSKRREAIARFHAQAVKFRECFAADLAAIENDTLGHLNLMEYLRVAYNERHAAAILAFEPSISRGKASGFRDAWNRYRYGENEDGSAAAVSNEGLDHDEFYFLCYLSPGHSWETHIPKPAKQKALERMHALLSYASEA